MNLPGSSGYPEDDWYLRLVAVTSGSSPCCLSFWIRALTPVNCFILFLALWLGSASLLLCMCVYNHQVIQVRISQNLNLPSVWFCCEPNRLNIHELVSFHFIRCHSTFSLSVVFSSDSTLCVWAMCLFTVGKNRGRSSDLHRESGQGRAR